ncbi:peptide deformylase [Aequorivita antarctica]|uniref:Peptide deformylase n=1 Tax=Aequorivita antarctica TaxID=153266 RepID=A0A5C6YXS9_9FLAO|nr:peptide deformylase [Aequorivita antarctica]TXD72446.1 peptide deformylase [Aequorivita antarctica]SRX75576.1 Peptide deformylase [Aequorivita antarctica]
MILPIVAYGDPVLRKETEVITKQYPKLDVLLNNMFETMYQARGIGLAAPQVGASVRLFIVDATPFEDDEDLSEEEQKFVSTFKRVFINARILDESGDEWAFNEGCLSIPDVREDVFRQPDIVIEYEDENFKKHKETFSGIVARIIQHEYDHIEGILFTDKLSPLKKRLIKSKLANISKGNVSIDYRMKFPNVKKKR